MFTPVQIGDATLYCGDARYASAWITELPDAVLLDPPFDQWENCHLFKGTSTTIAFTNHQNRCFTEKRLGIARTEIIWHFRDGRWVSPRLPRITHENILVYGETAGADVGDRQCLAMMRKGNGAIGRDRLGPRIYDPKDQKHLNSVLEFPRNVGGALGVWGKPIPLLQLLFDWINAPSWFDPYMGSGSAGVACANLGCRYVGVEIDRKVFDIACERIDNASNLSQHYSDRTRAAELRDLKRKA